MGTMQRHLDDGEIQKPLGKVQSCKACVWQELTAG